MHDHLNPGLLFPVVVKKRRAFLWVGTAGKAAAAAKKRPYDERFSYL